MLVRFSTYLYGRFDRTKNQKNIFIWFVNDLFFRNGYKGSSNVNHINSNIIMKKVKEGCVTPLCCGTINSI